MAECDVIYAGRSYPRFHGTKCFRAAPHEGFRHMAVVENTPLQWWTPDEKEVIRQRNKEKNGNHP